MKYKVVEFGRAPGDDAGASEKGVAPPEEEAELDASIFAVPLREDILHRVVRWQLARRQAGTHQVQNRSAVAGSTRKIKRQKGSGGARHGSSRVSQFRGGGRAFGPVSRSHAHQLPKKVRRQGLRIALSVKHSDGDLVILNSACLAAPRTVQLQAELVRLGVKDGLFLVGGSGDRNLLLASRNLSFVSILPVQGANVHDILRHKTLLLEKTALSELEGRLT